MSTLLAYRVLKRSGDIKEGRGYRERGSEREGKNGVRSDARGFLPGMDGLLVSALPC